MPFNYFLLKMHKSLKRINIVNWMRFLRDLMKNNHKKPLDIADVFGTVDFDEDYNYKKARKR